MADSEDLPTRTVEAVLNGAYFPFVPSMTRTIVELLPCTNIKDAVLLSYLFMPETVTIDGWIFLRIPGPENIEAFEKRVRQGLLNRPPDKGSVAAFVDSYNWIELEPFFSHERGAEEVADRVYQSLVDTLASRLRDAWEAWLKQRHPHAGLVVRIFSESETGGHIGIGFTQSKRIE
jgi:hypothetical protein